MQFSFIHAADIHLDSPLRGLERYEGAPIDDVRGATRRALENLVDLAVDERVAFVILAGDVYDGDWKDYNTGLFFAAQMRRLREAAIRVFVVSGNHDARSQITRELRLPDNVYVFSAKRAETVRVEAYGVAIHGQSFASRHISEDLSSGYPDAIEPCFNIGVLHTSADGREGHATYAPCSVASLTSKGYDYWALGHVHAREVLSEAPWIVFSGNLQSRNVRERGAKGASVVRVDAGDVIDVEHRALDVLRWASIQVDVSAAEDLNETLGAVSEALERELTSADGRLLAARVEIRGSTPLHDAMLQEREQLTNQIRELASDVGAGRLWIEKVRWRTCMAIDLEEARRADEVIGGLLRTIDELAGDEERLRELIESELATLRKTMPADADDSDDGLRLSDPDVARELLTGARDLLLPRLLDIRELR